MTAPSVLPLLRPVSELPGVNMQTGVDLSTLDSFGRVLAAYDCPSQTGVFERLFLFALVAARRPARILEIGFRFGGTSFLMLQALADADSGGRLVALDPAPEPALDFSRFGEQFTLVQGSSPDDVPRAVAALGGPIELCHVDGNHDLEPVRADLEAIYPHLAPDAYVLLHDAYWPDVRQATEDFLQAHADTMVDCGFVAPFPNDEGWGGVRMLRRGTSTLPTASRPAAAQAAEPRRGLFGWRR